MKKAAASVMLAGLVSADFVCRLSQKLRHCLLIPLPRILVPLCLAPQSGLLSDFRGVSLRENGFFERLVRHLSKNNEKVEGACKAAKTIRTWRMKKVAHRDLRTAMSKGATLDSVNIAQVDKVLSLAGNAINLVYLSLTDTSWSWNLISPHDLELKSKEPLRFSEEWTTSRFRDA